MQYEHYFPLGIAKGPAFIGRDDDAQWLLKNIEARIHTLLLAPRRFGKSSLALHVLKKSKFDYVEIDLQLSRSAAAVERKIINGISQLINSIAVPPEVLLGEAKQFFKKAKKQWNIGLKGLVSLSIEPEQYDDVAENILTALQLLESIFKAQKKNAVIFMDEIQEIISFDESLEIQGAIRHFAQKSNHIAFIFSGSNRRLLQVMFDDSTMPLYQLCDTLTLEKISPDDYRKYIDFVAKKTWQKTLAPEVIDEILKISERHPRRTYHLCLYLWRLNESKKSLPKLADVAKAWEKILSRQRKGIRLFLSKLNTGQLKILTYIAIGNQSDLTSKEAQRRCDLSATAISKALLGLEAADLISSEIKHTYEINDPVIKSILCEDETTILT